MQLPDLRGALPGRPSWVSWPFEPGRLLVAQRLGLQMLTLGAIASGLVVLPNALARWTEDPSGAVAVVAAPSSGKCTEPAEGWQEGRAGEGRGARRKAVPCGIAGDAAKLLVVANCSPHGRAGADRRGRVLPCGPL